MTPYSYIKDVIEHGNWISVKDNEGKFRTFTFVNGSGGLQGTSVGDSLEESLHIGLTGNNYDETAINEYYSTNGVLNEYHIITPPRKLFEEGDEVVILEGAREIAGFEEWCEEVKDMVGGVYHIGNVFGMSYEINGYHFPHHVLAPAYKPKPTLSDEEAREMIEKLKRAGKIKDGEVVV